jgi:hypothetical protein
MVLSAAVVVTAGTAAVVLTILAAVLAAIFTPVFSAVLATVFTTRRLVGLTRYRGCGQQRARDEKCTEQV